MLGHTIGLRSGKPTANDCIVIKLPKLKRLGMLKRGCTSRRSFGDLTVISDIDCFEPRPCLSITGRAFGRKIEQTIILESAPCASVVCGGMRAVRSQASAALRSCSPEVRRASPQWSAGTFPMSRRDWDLLGVNFWHWKRPVSGSKECQNIFASRRGGCCRNKCGGWKANSKR